MDDIEEPIKNLLLSTGWTLQDLFRKLQKYQIKTTSQDSGVDFSVDASADKSEVNGSDSNHTSQSSSDELHHNESEHCNFTLHLDPLDDIESEVCTATSNLDNSQSQKVEDTNLEPSLDKSCDSEVHCVSIGSTSTNDSDKFNCENTSTHSALDLDELDQAKVHCDSAIGLQKDKLDHDKLTSNSDNSDHNKLKCDEPQSVWASDLKELDPKLNYNETQLDQLKEDKLICNKDLFNLTTGLKQLDQDEVTFFETPSNSIDDLDETSRNNYDKNGSVLKSDLNKKCHYGLDCDKTKSKSTPNLYEVNRDKSKCDKEHTTSASYLDCNKAISISTSNLHELDYDDKSYSTVDLNELNSDKLNCNKEETNPKSNLNDRFIFNVTPDLNKVSRDELNCDNMESNPTPDSGELGNDKLLCDQTESVSTPEFNNTVRSKSNIIAQSNSTSNLDMMGSNKLASNLNELDVETLNCSCINAQLISTSALQETGRDKSISKPDLNCVSTDCNRKSDLDECKDSIKLNYATTQNMDTVVDKSCELRNIKNLSVATRLKRRTLLRMMCKIIRKYRIQQYKRSRKRRRKGTSKEKRKKNIRDKIKEQLELLRNKKKSPLSLPKPIKSPPQLLRKKNNSKISEFLLERLGESGNRSSNSNEKLNPKGSCSYSTNTSVFSSHVSSTQSLDSENSGTISNELFESSSNDFVITSVIGGYKSPETDDNHCENLKVINAELETEPIKPSKTTDVKKIKGWQKKKFLVPVATEERKLEYNSTQIPCSSNSITCTTDVDIKTKSDIKSAFISDSLDQYLNENSKLNISYEVPKLIAEEAVTQPPLDTPLMYSASEKVETSVKVKTEQYKPKTLAEKRKIMSAETEPNLLDVQKVVKKKPLKLKLEDILSTTVPFSKKETKNFKNGNYNFFVYNGRKLRVISKSNEKIVGRIKDGIRSNSQKSLKETIRDYQPSKPSLLRSLQSTKTEQVAYKPGPLSQKQNLQKNLHGEWRTVVVRLPRIYVEVTPQLGKVVHPRIEDLIKSDGLALEKERVNFALSTLHTERHNSQKFTFQVPYANGQQSIVVRKKISDNETLLGTSIVSDKLKTTEDIVKSVVDRMLDYVETKELGDLIKEDPDLENIADTSNFNPPSPICTNVSTIIKKPSFTRRRSKTALELKRLNVKIIEVNVEDQEQTEARCNNDFCRLGCVCSSLQCNPSSLIQEHCGLEKCMLECSCKLKKDSNGNQFTLPVGTDILSAKVVNQLQDVAKRDLAKVEKEFTQTVIKANNQTIVVGTDPKERLRRVTKIPKRYDDFIQNNTTETEPRDVTLKPIFISRTCVVKVKRYNFDNIVPFCLVHQLYQCHCGLKSIERSDNEESSKFATVENKIRKKKVIKDVKEKIEKLDDSEQSLFDDPQNCSRTRGLPTKYYLERNRTEAHLKKIYRWSKKLEKEKLAYAFEEAEKNETNNDNNNNESTSNSNEKVTEVRRSKRKQVIVELKDYEESEKPKKRKLKGSKEVRSHTRSKRRGSSQLLEKERKIRKQNDEAKAANERQVDDSKNGKEHLLNFTPKPIEDEFLRQLRLKGKDLNKKLHLMTWRELVQKFNNNSIYIWQSSNKDKSQILITDKKLRPFKNFFSIELFRQFKDIPGIHNDVVRWLIQGLPEDKHSDNLLVIISVEEKYWEICGICEKNKQTDKCFSLSLVRTNVMGVEKNETTSSASVKNDDSLNQVTSSTEQEENGDKNTETTVQKHKKKILDFGKNYKRVLHFSRHKYRSLTLISEYDRETDRKCQKPLKVALPYIEGGCRWRMIFLHKPFTYLYFVRSNYSIRYADLLKVPTMANGEDITVNLISPEMKRYYNHPKFGIFCVPHSRTEIFVGPYGFDENHDLEIWTYVNNVLVSTDLYNQLKKKMNASGIWYYQENESLVDDGDDDDVQFIQEKPAYVDLTEECSDNENNGENSNGTSSIISTDSNNKKQIEFTLSTAETDDQKRKEEKDVAPERDKVQSNSVDEEVANSEMMKIAEFNRQWEKHTRRRQVIVTNVPGLGCIRAYKCREDQTFSVKCPFTNRMRSFPSEAAAIAEIEKELSKVLVPVPSCFEIKCCVTTLPVGQDFEQIDRNLLQGNYAVGIFGVRPIKNISLISNNSEETLITTNNDDISKPKLPTSENSNISEMRTYADSSSTGKLLTPEVQELKQMDKKSVNEKAIRELKLVEKYFSRLKKINEKHKAEDSSNFNSEATNEKGAVPPSEAIKVKNLQNLIATKQDEEVSKDDTEDSQSSLVSKKFKGTNVLRSILSNQAKSILQNRVHSNGSVDKGSLNVIGKKVKIVFNSDFISKYKNSKKIFSPDSSNGNAKVVFTTNTNGQNTRPTVMLNCSSIGKTKEKLAVNNNTSTSLPVKGFLKVPVTFRNLQVSPPKLVPIVSPSSNSETTASDSPKIPNTDDTATATAGSKMVFRVTPTLKSCEISDVSNAKPTIITNTNVKLPVVKLNSDNVDNRKSPTKYKLVRYVPMQVVNNEKGATTTKMIPIKLKSILQKQNSKGQECISKTE